MSNLEECCEKYSLSIQKIEKRDSYMILYGIDSNYYLKDKDSFKKDLFSYLESIHYPYYLPIINDYTDSYELYPYYPDLTSDLDIKGKEIVKALFYLHSYSLYRDEFSLDDKKELYESLYNRIDSMMIYYHDLQKNIEEYSFPRLDYYTLLLNISSFYQILRLAMQKLAYWFEQETTTIRKSYILHNACLDNFCFGESSYFLNFKDCYKDILVYDFANFYRRDVKVLDMLSLFDFYQSKMNFDDIERSLFFALICIPDKITFDESIYTNIVYLQQTLEYIDKTLFFVSEKDKENQEGN